MYKLILLMLINSGLAFSQVPLRDTTTKYEQLFIESPLLPGKPLRESGQFFAIGFAFAAVGVSSIIIGDAIKNPIIEIFGDVLTISSLPFVCIGINRLYEAGRRQEVLESQYQKWSSTSSD